nr:trypsin-like peptidase domain-containing protein [Streptomyces sp. NBRC 110468]
MHDPDPYSTPPYGEPGPWAPAPPVQHPGVPTPPVQHTGVPTPSVQHPGVPTPDPAAHGAPPVPPTPGTAPATAEPAVPATPTAHVGPAAPTGQPAGPALPAVPVGHAAPAGQAVVPPAPAGQPAAPAVPPAPVGHAVPAAPAAPAAPLGQPVAPAAPAAPLGQPAASVGHTASVPPAAPATSAGHTAPPVPDAPVGHTAPVDHTAPVGHTAPVVPPGHVTPVGHTAPVASAGHDAPVADPWRRYDPWSANPLAGAGAGAPGGGHGGTGVGSPLQFAGAGGLTESEQRRQTRWRLLGGALAVALVAGLLGGAVGVHLERNGGLDPIELPQASAGPTGRPADSVAGIAARALPGVVTLHVSGSEESGTGTGFVLDSRGYILTNNHVVEPAGSDGGITVVFNGGQTADAEVVGRDSGYDLAVVRVTGVKGLKPLLLGNSDDVRVGDPVVAIGAPFDLEGTVTSGIISAKERPITAGGDGSDVSYVDALQTDAPINPGNSGGPLLDARGRVIGINSAIRSADDGTGSDSARAGSIGLGFAIPVNQGKRVAEELINTGRATHPVIGVTLDMDYTGDGARVDTADGAAGSPVTPGGPADRAGVRAGDVITAVDGRRVHFGEELIVKTRAHRPGDRLALTVERDGRERTLTLVLGSSSGG